MRAFLISLAALAACAQPETRPVVDNTPPSASTPQNAEDASAQDTCGMARFQHLLDTHALASEIDRSSLPPGTRIISPDMMVTQDFSAQRLNILTGSDGRVSSLRCF